MSDYSTVRSGWDAPSRISGTSVMPAGADESLPGEPSYQFLVPFQPPATVSGAGTETPSSALTADGRPLWKQVPSRCDLLFYQGDDVVIPLFFPDDGSMADQDTWSWFAQIRLLHSYRSTFVNEFVCRSENIDATTEEDAEVMVEMFLSRDDNVYSGFFRWDLYALSPADLTRFNLEGPQDDTLKTWLYGVVTIVPRVTSTDVLPPPVTPPSEITPVGQGGYFTGPNGRVP